MVNIKDLVKSHVKDGDRLSHSRGFLSQTEEFRVREKGFLPFLGTTKLRVEHCYSLGHGGQWPYVMVDVMDPAYLPAAQDVKRLQCAATTIRQYD